MNLLEKAIKRFRIPGKFHFFIIGIILVEILTIFLIISDYGNCFQDSESICLFTPSVIKNGTAFSWHDFVNAFNAWGLDGDSRSRFLSYFSYILIIKTRLFLWNFFPPHPTLSISWILTLLLAPILLFKFLQRILNNKTASWTGVALYLASSGYLFSATMIFHPGKALLNVIVIAILLVIAQHIKERKDPIEGDTNPLIQRSLAQKLCMLLLVGLFLDESGIFYFLIMPLWCPEYFFPRRWTSPNIKICLRNAGVYLIPLGIFLFVITVIAPAITMHAFGKKLELLKFMGHELDTEKFKPGYLLFRAVTLFSASLLPWKMISLPVPIARHTLIPHLGLIVIFYVGILVFCTYLAKRNKIYWKPYQKILALLLSYVLLQTLITGFHTKILVLTGYYYGAAFSLLFSIFVAVSLAALMSQIKWGRLIALFLICYMIAIQFTNFHKFNLTWHIHSSWKSMGSFQKKGYYAMDQRELEHLKMKLLSNSLGSHYHLNGLEVVDTKEEATRAKEIWKAWKNQSCDSIEFKHDLVFLRNLWAIGELCPGRYYNYFSDVKPLP